MADLSAFELLGKIRDDAVQLAGQSLNYAAQSTSVKNVAYVVNGVNFYCDAKDVKEISTVQNLLKIPQTKRWMRGLVNSKGVLYSVTDLSLFAGFDRPTQENRGHLLLLSDKEKQSALLVNRVIGFRYFDGMEPVESLAGNQDLPEGLSSFVVEGFRSNDETWYRLDIDKLLESEQFREVQ